MSLEDRLQKIKNNWIEFKALDPTFQSSESSMHHYELRDVLHQQELESFEAQHAIQLPDEYKNYLLEVSNGGIGIGGKMYSLQESLNPLQNNPSFSAENHLKKPFIFTEEKIIDFLKKRLSTSNSAGTPVEMNYSDGGYLFLSQKSEDSYYILILNGACKEEVFELKKVEIAQSNGEIDRFFEIQPVVKFKDDQIKTFSFLDWLEDEQENWFNPTKDLDRQLEGIKTMWFNYKHWDKNQQVFGAFMHHYELKETLTEEFIKDFETNYHCSLPIEYRQYLKLVTNGGVGPQYGMYSLQNATIPLNSGSLDQGNFVKYLEAHPDHYSKPFPISEAQVVDYIKGRLHNNNSIPIRIPKDTGGYVFLSEYGCGGYYISPVNGVFEGQVFYLQKLDGNKLTYELHDDNGNLIQSGSYGEDNNEDFFEIYPEVSFHDQSASTVMFLDWMRNQQIIWFDELNKDQPVAGDSNLNNENAYYPLAVGNAWKYKYAGMEMTTTINSCDDLGVFVVGNSMSDYKSNMQKENGEYLSDSYESGKMQMILKDDLILGDTWEVKYKANTIDCMYSFEVKEIHATFTVDGKEYNNVAMVESASNMVMNGVITSMNSFIQSYYAKGIGLILMTTSGVAGSTRSSLMSFDLK